MQTTAMDCSALTRTDVDLRFRVMLCLTRHGHQALMNVEVEAIGGVVTLRGTIPSSQLRRLAIATVRHTAGVIQVSDCTQNAAPRMRSKRPMQEMRQLGEILAERLVDS